MSGATSAGGSLFAGSPPRSRRRMTWLRKLAYRGAAPLLSTLMRLLWATWRVRVLEEQHACAHLAAGRTLIPCFWHEQLLLGGLALRRLQRCGLRPCWLISPSIDGELAARIARRWRVRIVRGSATRTGLKALRELHRVLRREGVAPITLPDGPQGPRRSFKAGTVMLAQLGEAPILPIGCAARGTWRLPTWDRLMIPRPFTRVAIVLGEPHAIRRDLPSSELEARRREMEALLEDLTRRAGDALSSELSTQIS